MAYISNFYKGTTVQFTIPVGALYPNTTLEIWDEVIVKLALVKGGTTVIDKTELLTASGVSTGNVSIELTVTDTNISEGTYFYEIYFRHSDTLDIIEYEEEYVVEASKVKCLERI